MPEVLMKMIGLPEGFSYAGVYRVLESFEWWLCNDRPFVAVPDSTTGKCTYGFNIILNGPGNAEKLKWLRATKADYIAARRKDGRTPGRWLADLVAAIETLEHAGAN